MESRGYVENNAPVWNLHDKYICIRQPIEIHSKIPDKRRRYRSLETLKVVRNRNRQSGGIYKRMSDNDFTIHYNESYASLFSFALQLTTHKQDAEDLLQDTVTKAYTNLHRFKPGSNFGAWIRRILRNIFIDKYRKTSKRKVMSQTLEELIDIFEMGTGNDDENNYIIRNELDRLVNMLPYENKYPFILFFQGYSYEQIADYLDIPMGTLKSRIFIARKKLVELYEEYYTLNDDTK